MNKFLSRTLLAFALSIPFLSAQIVTRGPETIFYVEATPEINEHGALQLPSCEEVDRYNGNAFEYSCISDAVTGEVKTADKADEQEVPASAPKKSQPVDYGDNSLSDGDDPPAEECNPEIVQCNIVWGGGDPPPVPPTMSASDDDDPPPVECNPEIQQCNIVWGGGDPPPEPPAANLQANIVWGGGDEPPMSCDPETGVCTPVGLTKVKPAGTIQANIVWGGGDEPPMNCEPETGVCTPIGLVKTKPVATRAG